MKLIDVRSKEEYESGHLKDAVNIAVEDMASGILPDFPKDTPILTYCNFGGRAGRAKTILESAGFTNVENGGGYRELKVKGY